jgi:hypothetical protein
MFLAGYYRTAQISKPAVALARVRRAHDLAGAPFTLIRHSRPQGDSCLDLSTVRT